MTLDPLRRVRYELRSFLGSRPGLFLPLARLERTLRPDPHRLAPRPLTDRTELVLEGYPRSANTFAAAAFLSAQPGHVEVAHHLHAPAQVIAAVRRGLPALVLIREPVAAIVSLIIFAPFLTPVQALRSYRRFHRAVLPHRDRFVTADFREVITDFGAVIDRLNAEMGTRFARFDHHDESVARCFAEIEERNRRLFGGKLSEAWIARPSDVRGDDAARLRSVVEAPRLAPLLEECRRLYGQLTPLGHGAAR
ncbi:MAG: hypothetical protein R3325_04940 [Thermoanaerobaculia bacterium]|nr:hypothetical protein [Thermoanaerobaculia bacterium]